MKLKSFILTLSLIFVSVGLSLFFIFNFSSKGKIKKSKFNKYVTSFSATEIAKDATVFIYFKNKFTKEVEDLTSVFKIKPNITGTISMIGKRGLRFTPEKDLISGEKYNVHINLQELFDGIEPQFEEFEFEFKVQNQNFKIKNKELKTDEKNLSAYSFEIELLDIESLENLKPLIDIRLDNQQLDFDIEARSSKKYRITTRNFPKEDYEQELIVNLELKKIGVDRNWEHKIKIPEKGIFKVISVKANKDKIRINFSNPIAHNQYWENLIELSNQSKRGFSYQENENSLIIYFNKTIIGTKVLRLNKEIRDFTGSSLKDVYEQKLHLSYPKPQVKLISSGTIVSNPEDLKIFFKSISLKAVDVIVTKIYDQNIYHFLQENELNGSRRLKNYARRIYSKKIKLKTDNLFTWSSHSVDLSKFFKEDPNAIYRIKLAFKKEYYSASEDEDKDDLKTRYIDSWNKDESSYSENSYWDGYNSGYSYWENRNDPTKDAYYFERAGRFPSINLMYSQLGMIVKKSSEDYFVFVNNIESTEAISGAEVKAINYQGIEIGSFLTDDKGVAKCKLNQKPYLFVAQYQGNRTYIKVVKSQSNMLSMFDLSGVKTKNGVKGKIYAERGVWRPGDKLHLFFILEDKQNTIPISHPLVFELKNNLSKVVNKQVTSINELGMYAFTVPTNKEYPTGNYTATIQLGGLRFEKNIKIETVIPNKLDIQAKIDKMIIKENEKINFDIEVKWLHGAIAKNLDTKVEVNYTEIPTKFKQYPNYIFTNPSSKFSSEDKEIKNTKLDQFGKLQFSENLELKGQPSGFVKATFTTRVFEESGRYSSDFFSAQFSPYHNYVGIQLPKGDKKRNMLLTDTTHLINVVTVDTEGKAKMRKGLKAKIYKINWRWWWDKSYDDLGNYLSRSSLRPIMQKTFNTNAQGKAQVKFRINYPNWGRYIAIIKDKEGHSSAQTFYIDWPGWAGKAQKGIGDGADILSFQSEKSEYTVGEKAQITIPSAKGTKAIVSIEKADKIIDYFELDCEETKTTFELPINEGMSPNIYVCVNLIQAKQNNQNDRPIRMHGYLPIKVVNPANILKPHIEMEDELKPLDEFQVEVTEVNGKSMAYMLNIVDEGLLSLTRFSTPNPYVDFYSKEALNISTWDMYSDIMGAIKEKVFENYNIGGGDEGENSNNEGQKVDRFKPVVLSYGPFNLKSGERKIHKIKLPNYIGAVRCMVVGAKNGAYGASSKRVLVKKDLMVYANLPRSLSLEETAEVPVTLFVTDKKIKTVEVQIKPNKYFDIIEPSKIVKFSEIGEKMVNLKIKTKQKEGTATVEVIAHSGSEKSIYSFDIEVKNNNPILRVVEKRVLKPNEKLDITIKALGDKATNKLVVEASKAVQIDFSKHLNYLIKYPYGCIEQTTSGAFPQLYLNELFDLNDEQVKKSESNIIAAIKRLEKFETFDGGFSYWPNESSANEWGTSYAGHFLLQAENRAYEFKPERKQSWINYQKTKSRNWRYSKNLSSNLNQAYRLYTLALAGKADLSSMNRMKERIQSMSLQVQYQLASAYILAGLKDIAEEIVDNLAANTRIGRTDQSTFGSKIRDQIIIFECLNLLDRDLEANNLLQQISNQVNKKEYLSTQTAAFCLTAVANYAKKMNAEGIDISCSYNNKSETLKTQSLIAKAEFKNFDIGEQKIQLINNTNQLSFVTAISYGKPLGSSVDNQSNGLKLNCYYSKKDGTKIAKLKELEQSVDLFFTVNITNQSNRDLKNMALETPFASGFEIDNPRLKSIIPSYMKSVPTYQNIRDNKVYSFFDIKKGEQKIFVFKLNATYKGIFKLGSVKVEAMYEPEIYANYTATETTVRIK